MKRNDAISFDVIIRDIQAKILLSERVGRDVTLTRKGHEFLGLCPFHHEKTPSFTVNDQKGFYHCFGCGAHGNLVNYVMGTQNLPFKEAITLLAREAGITPPQFSREQSQADAVQKRQKQSILDVMQAAAQYCAQVLLTSPAAAKAREYLNAREVSVESIRKFQLGFCDGSLLPYLQQNFPKELIDQAGLVTSTSYGVKDRFVGRVLFPIVGLDGKVIAFGGRLLAASSSAPKYLNSPETPVFHKGSSLYNLFAAREHAKQKPLIVVEGYMDAVSMVQNGFPQTIAALGTALTDLHIQTLWRYSDHPILCFDGDLAGMKASVRAAMRALPILKPGKTLFFCYLPAGKDPDDMLKEQGSNEMQKLLDRSVPLASVVWNSLLARYMPENQNESRPFVPEDMAALKQDILATAQMIEHEDIKRLYRDVLLDRFFQLMRERREGQRIHNNFQHKSPRLISKTKKNDIYQKILLGIVLKEPKLLQVVNEQLGMLECSDSKLLQIRSWLLDKYFSNEDLENAFFLEQCAEFLAMIGRDDFKVHAPFVLQETSEEGLLERWKEIWQCTVETEFLQADKEAIAQDLKKNFDEHYWERMKTLAISNKIMETTQ